MLGEACAETLNYGPEWLGENGSSSGLSNYFSTNRAANVEHDTWIQIVMSEDSNELFRIYWRFGGIMNVTERMISAVSTGEVVDYLVVDADGTNYKLNGTWYFSSTSQVNQNTFTRKSTTPSLSSDDGVWGAGSGTLDGDGSTIVPSTFWGVGNFHNKDLNCNRVYKNGSVLYKNETQGVLVTNIKTYMYAISIGECMSV